MLLLDQSSLIPLVWNGSHSLPGNVDRLEHLLDGSLGDLDVEVVFDMFEELLEGGAWGLLKQQKDGGDDIGRLLGFGAAWVLQS